MRILTLHSDFIEIEPKSKSIEQAVDIKKPRLKIKECLVVLSAVQKTDEGSEKTVAKRLVSEVEDIADKVNTNKIVLYPYVHLVSNPSNPDSAKQVLDTAAKSLKKKFKVTQAPFGWNKSMEVKTKGHPLSELSREFGVEEVKEREKKSKIFGFKVILPNGQIKNPKAVKDKVVKYVIEEEIGKGAGDKKAPIHIELVQKLAIAGREPVSDSGCFRWYPNGAFIKQLIRDRTWELFVSKFGAYPITTPVIIRKDDSGVKWLARHFPERQYTVLPGKKDRSIEFALKTAGDYATFSMFRDMPISYKNLPITLYEDEQYDHRYEQSGELRGLNRVREFEMHNVHSLCENEKTSYNFFKKIFIQECEILQDIGFKPDALIFYCDKNALNKYKDYLKKLAKKFKVPVVVELLSEITVYMGAWVDFIVLDSSNRPMEVATSQIDSLSAKHWNISFTNKKGKKSTPYIIHTGFGVERATAALLETLARNRNPIFPLWLSPTQIRVCPVSDKFLKAAKKLADQLEHVRVDIDDRKESIGKKVSYAEKEWAPMVIVIGEKEKKAKKLPVRFRETGKIKSMSVVEIIKLVEKETKDKPFRPLPLPRLLSKRPIFA